MSAHGAASTGGVVERLLLTRREAAAALGVSLRHFQRHVQPFVPCVYSGQLRLYRPADLQRWAADAVYGERRVA
jgi:hypothetical protein